MTTREMADMTDKSDRRRLAELLLVNKGREGLEDFVRQRRSDGKSWAEISFELRELIDVNVSYEALRRWFPDEEDDGGAAD